MRGWCVTDDPGDAPDSSTPSRVGWGQISAADVEDAAEQIVFRQINIIEGLNPKTIEQPVRLRLRGDGENEPDYIGVISRSWLESPEVLAFAPLYFGEADTGSAIMEYECGHIETRVYDDDEALVDEPEIEPRWVVL